MSVGTHRRTDHNEDRQESDARRNDLSPVREALNQARRA